MPTLPPSHLPPSHLPSGAGRGSLAAPARPHPAKLTGIGVSPGIALGRVRVYERPSFPCPKHHVGAAETASEIARLHTAIAQLEGDLAAFATAHAGAVPDGVTGDATTIHADLAEVQKLMLRDPAFVGEIEGLVTGSLINVEWALARTLGRWRDTFAAVQSSYFRERWNDIEALGQRLLGILTGHSGSAEHESGPADEGLVIVAGDLTPSDMMNLRRGAMAGFCLEYGSKTCHVAIMARALGLPAVVGVKAATERLSDGDVVVIDGFRGELAINPSDEALAEYDARRAEYAALNEKVRREQHEPPTTRCGMRVGLYANLEMAEEVPLIHAQNVDGIGLYRSEFLYFNRDDLPGEDEQFEHYRDVVAQFAPSRVVIRTLDVGADKPLPGLSARNEVNPALGLRGIRLSLDRPELFRVQLRALLRAGVYGRLGIMLPMVSGVAELSAFHRILARVKDELEDEGVAFDRRPDVGVLIEVPAAALIADWFAAQVDFLAIGTNDLTQYTLAVDRQNENLAGRYKPWHPSMLRLMRHVVEAGWRAGVPVSVCGEMAGEPAAAPLLLAMGVSDLSMNASALSAVRAIIRHTTMDDARAMLRAALEAPTTEAVENGLHRFMRRNYPEFALWWP
jgi:phosphoenolpyruvate-protein phosphotransferase (PTS system enzyme I)